MGNFFMEAFFKVYMWAERYKSVVITFFVVLTILCGLWVYMVYYHLEFLQSLSYTLALFAMDVKIPNEITDAFGEIDAETVKKAAEWVHIYKVSLLAKFTVIMTFLLLYTRKILTWVYRKLVVRRGDHTIVVGLGRNSRFFVRSMLETEQHKMIVFELNKENEYLDNYRTKRVSIVVGEVEKFMEKLNIAKAKTIFISTGNDEKNIYYALKFLEYVKEEKKNRLIKLIVHIEDRTLRNFYSDDGALKDKKVEMKVFSFYKESARILLQGQPLDGTEREIIESGKDFSINVIGATEMSIALIIEAYKLAHYPHGNKLTINLVAKDTSEIKKKMKFLFPSLDLIEDIEIHYRDLDFESIEFYESDIWNSSKHLTNVYYCHDDVTENIRIATKVKDMTFLRRKEEAKEILFHIATYNQIKIAEEIVHFYHDNVSVFAQASKVFSQENMLKNKIDTMAKMIHYDYALANGKRKLLVDEVWRETNINDRKSSVGQAIHIQTKLKFLGVSSTPSRLRDVEQLEEHNIKVLDKALDVKNLSHREVLQEGQNKLDLIAEAEHRRWMALYFIMDYVKGEKKDKLTKTHPLLKKFSEFTQEEFSHYSRFDKNAILKIAKYEATIGNELISTNKN